MSNPPDYKFTDAPPPYTPFVEPVQTVPVPASVIVEPVPASIIVEPAPTMVVQPVTCEVTTVQEEAEIADWDSQDCENCLIITRIFVEIAHCLAVIHSSR